MIGSGTERVDHSFDRTCRVRLREFTVDDDSNSRITFQPFYCLLKRLMRNGGSCQYISQAVLAHHYRTGSIDDLAVAAVSEIAVTLLLVNKGTF